ncbi:adenylyl cyclase-associated protein 1-like isoform X2 [Portunus trituberculatus]|uniref:adenylyl cyclase-associated protein 1-like isoform X2 n=1 Tax=Portunus trituberculatus TaxID=210409 RepID=UPI001E1CCFEF|nr:adenylyl cyclase-associated protein 1-like isoform X2 [Portunus trituberculatus]
MGVTASTTRDANPSSGSSSRGRSTKRRSPVGCSSASGSELRCYSGYSSEDQCSCSECDSELPSTPRERRPPLRTQSEVLRGPHQPYVRGYIADTKTPSAAKPREGRVVRRPSQPLVKNYIADIQNRSGNKAESRERKAKHDLPSHTHQTHNTLPSPRPTTYPNPEECTVPFVLAYDDLLSGPFKTFFDTSQKIGGDVATITNLVQECFINQRAFLVMASKSQRPLDTELPQVLEPTGKKIQAVIAFRESNRQSKFFNHLSAISESISGLSWVAVAPAPAPYVKEMGDSAMFYSNRVLKDYREKDKVHVEWVQNLNNVWKELQEYVRKYHTTGLSWNTRGGNAMNNLKAAPPNCGVPPPPPPGIPPPPPMVKLEPKAAPADDGRSALFASINKGTEITAGLKKVTDDMKTHKNPSLREGPKPFVKQSSPSSRASPAKDVFAGTPKLALEGKKWFVEYQKDNQNIKIDAKMDQCVYIFRCQNVVVQVKGKLNSIILDSCKKSAVVFDDLVSALEVVNCQSSKVQVMGVMPTISIEKTDGCQVFLSKASLNTEIISAKSSEMNIMVPKPDGEFAELAIPEQFLTKVNGLSLTTTCTESC